MSVFTPLTWNCDRRINRDSSFTSNFSGGWINKLKNDGSWDKINIDFTEDSTSFSLNGTPFGFSAPKTSGGSIRFTDSVNFDPDTMTTITSAPIGKTKTFTGTNNVHGVWTPDGILYKNAYSFGDILIQSHQQFVKQLVVFNSEPSGTGDIAIPFIQELDSGLSTKTMKGSNLSLIKEKDVGSGLAFVQSDTRSIFTKPAYVWDSAGKYLKIRVMVKNIGNTLYCRKIIPRSFLAKAVYPVFTDTVDTFTANTADQGISGSNPTFSTYRSGSGLGLEAVGRTTNYAVCWLGGSDYVGYRVYSWWATGATIPSGDTISSASLDVFYPDTHASLSRTVYLVENRQASTSLATTDWGLIGSSGVGTGTGEPFGSITRTSLEASKTYTYTINSNGQSLIAKGSGNTYFCCIESDDWDNNAPVAEGTTGSNFNSADAASNKPVLSVTHAPAVTGFSGLLSLGVG